MLRRIGLAALLCVAPNAWADAGASLKILDIRATVLNPDGSLLTLLYDGVPADSFFSVYAKDGTLAKTTFHCTAAIGLHTHFMPAPPQRSCSSGLSACSSQTQPGDAEPAQISQPRGAPIFVFTG